MTSAELAPPSHEQINNDKIIACSFHSICPTMKLLAVFVLVFLASGTEASNIKNATLHLLPDAVSTVSSHFITKLFPCATL